MRCRTLTFIAMKTIDILQKFELFEELWTPKIIGEVNGQLIKIAKVKGEFVWHKHDLEDEMFMVYKGELNIDFRTHSEKIGQGQFCVVPKGVEHKPWTNGEEVWIMMIEPMSTLNTGDINSDRTVNDLEKL